MPSKILSARGVAAFLAFAVTMPLVGRATAEEPRVGRKEGDDSAKPKADGESLTVSLAGKGGIGKYSLERTEQSWWKGITICLHTSGLEMFRVTSGDVVVSASVSSTQPTELRVTSIKGTEEIPLSPKDPLWIAIKPLDKERKPATKIPLEGGYFQITLPAALWKDNPAEIQLEWIDFYRG